MNFRLYSIQQTRHNSASSFIANKKYEHRVGQNNWAGFFKHRDIEMFSGLKVGKMSEVSEFCLEKVSVLHISA